MLLPEPEPTQDLVHVLNEIGSEDEQRSTRAAQSFSESCEQMKKTKHRFHALLQCLRAVAEITCMQCTAPDEDSANTAGRVASELPDVLGPAAVLLRRAAEEGTDWNIDFLDVNGEKAWQTSILAHLLCFLGAAHRSVNDRPEDVPAAIKPFMAFNDLDEAKLNSTFWPGASVVFCRNKVVQHFFCVTYVMIQGGYAHV